MTEDQFEKRCADFDNRLEKLETLLLVAYNGAGVMNANASLVIDGVNTIGQMMNALTETVGSIASGLATVAGRVDALGGRVDSLQATVGTMAADVATLKTKVDSVHATSKAIAQHLLAPEELRTLGIPALLPSMPETKRAV